jgi:hypothetical protein
MKNPKNLLPPARRVWKVITLRVGVSAQNSNCDTTCAANTLTTKEVWNCKRDEGRPLGAGDQELAPNHCELLALRALVVSVAGKGGRRSRQV